MKNKFHESIYAEGMSKIMNPERDSLLKQLTALDFMATDLQLYLNTHPADTEALNIYTNTTENARTVRAAYEKQFGPLTADANNADTWQWINEPWPWQADFNFRLEPEGRI
ncbi:MAG: spore coat protein CotJB [Defluviitaleaceae bacterium]|nr:spore coat protein CotJB [Defluviitaleaceae bacterium]